MKRSPKTGERVSVDVVVGKERVLSHLNPHPHPHPPTLIHTPSSTHPHPHTLTEAVGDFSRHIGVDSNTLKNEFLVI